jgi:hypothetical protein
MSPDVAFHRPDRGSGDVRLGIYGGLDLLRTRPTPAPLSVVQHDAQALNMEAAELIGRVGEETTG